MNLKKIFSLNMATRSISAPGRASDELTKGQDPRLVEAFAVVDTIPYISETVREALKSIIRNQLSPQEVSQNSHSAEGLNQKGKAYIERAKSAQSANDRLPDEYAEIIEEGLIEAFVCENDTFYKYNAIELVSIIRELNALNVMRELSVQVTLEKVIGLLFGSWHKDEISTSVEYLYGRCVSVLQDIEMSAEETPDAGRILRAEIAHMRNLGYPQEADVLKSKFSTVSVAKLFGKEPGWLD